MNKNIKILVVDDLLSMRGLIIESLNTLGFKNILEAADGKIALDLLLNKQVDLLITDWTMPNMDGLELTKQIRTNNKIATLKILMISARNSKEEIALATSSGVNGYITKPFKLKTLENHLQNLLGNTDLA